MQVFIRVDASRHIGTGHVVRCLALADAWTTSTDAPEIAFIMREHEGSLCYLVEQHGYRVVRLPCERDRHYAAASPSSVDYENWLGATEAEDADQTVQLLGSTSADYVLVDHYAIGAGWHNVVRRFCGGIIAVDDLANRQHACEVLIDSSPGKHASAYNGLVPDSCIRLVGAEYAVLRQEFSRARKESLDRRGKLECRHLLVAMGGVDKDNTTSLVLDALAGAALPSDIEISVVLGANAPWEQAVRLQAEKMPHQVRFLVGVSNMAELMLDADLAIGAAGSMALERCCMGLPSIQVVVAENQIGSAKALQTFGAALTAQGPDLIGAIRMQLTDLLENPLRLSAMSQVAGALVDGRGAERIVSKIAGFVAVR